jgi:hypothetical protein
MYQRVPDNPQKFREIFEVKLSQQLRSDFDFPTLAFSHAKGGIHGWPVAPKMARRARLHPFSSR